MGTNESNPESQGVATYSDAESVSRYADLAASGELFVPERKVIDRHFRRPNARVLDVGCGVGRTTVNLAERGFDVTGVDVSEEMIRQGRALFPDLDLRIGDALDLPFDSNAFDYVLFSYGGLDMIQPESERKRALVEMRRVLDRDGLLAYSFHNEWYGLPALLADRTYLLNFYVRHGNLGRLGEDYKVHADEYDARYYFTNPLEQRRHLRELGYELLDVVGKRESPLKYLESQPYYVARKRS